ncbi:MAG TPA: cytochrome c3 family protein, partial [Vicinamibacteria bacterium]|nr:cytochrome c3 family protein [Vicinamibacteria bacterium]
DFVYFNHAIHVNKGVGCVSCHGRVDLMPAVQKATPLTMSWCLECHRRPEANLRPLSEITNMAFRPARDAKARQRQLAGLRPVSPPVQCSGCHR